VYIALSNRFRVLLLLFKDGLCSSKVHSHSCIVNQHMQLLGVIVTIPGSFTSSFGFSWIAADFQFLAVSVWFVVMEFWFFHRCQFYVFFLTTASLLILGSFLCIFSCFCECACQYQCSLLPGKTYPQNDLLCVEWDIKFC